MHRLYTRTEGRSDKAITILTNSAGYSEKFLRSERLSTDASQIGSAETRAFTLHL